MSKCPLKDTYYFDLIRLNCENATSEAFARHTVGLFPKEARVFVKIGETRENNNASHTMNTAMGLLGMPSVLVHVMPIVWDEDQWQRLSQQGANATKHPTWGPAMIRKMKSTVKRHAASIITVTMQVSAMFQGVRLGSLVGEYPKICNDILKGPNKSMTLSKTLYDVLLFAEYAGVTDSGPYNTIVDKDGRVLLVDINIAGEDAMVKYNTKGLFCSSHKFADIFITQVVCYMLANWHAVADFIVQLKQHARKNPYLRQDAMCPFFDQENIELLHSANTNHAYVQFLITSLRFNPLEGGGAPPARWEGGTPPAR